MVDYIKSKDLVVKDWEEEAMKAGVKCSVGYLRKAAKKNLSIGSKLIDYFLSKFPEVDVIWLITGIHLRTITDKNGTSVQPDDDIEEKKKAAVNAALVESLERENKNLWEVLKKDRGGRKGGKTRVSDN